MDKNKLKRYIGWSIRIILGIIIICALILTIFITYHEKVIETLLRWSGYDQKEAIRQLYKNKEDRQKIQLIGRWADGPCEAISVLGKTLYFGNGGNFVIADISNPGTIIELSRVQLPSFIRDIFIQGDFAYVANSNGGLQVVTIHDPKHPQIVGSYQSIGDATTVAVSGHYAFVDFPEEGLKVINVANPANPQEVANVKCNPSLRFRKTLFFGKNEFQTGKASFQTQYACLELLFSLKVIDINHPLGSKEIGSYETSGWIRSLCQVKNYIYFIDDGGRLRIINFENPARPQTIGELNVSGLTRILSVNGNFLYVTGEQFGLKILDVSSPSKPEEVSTYKIKDGAMKLVVSGEYAYVACGYNGVRILDVNNPKQLSEVGFLDTRDNTGEVAVSGTHAYVANGRDGLRVLDISNPAQPEEIASLNIPGRANGVSLTGSYVYVSSYDHGIRIIDISHPSRPVEVGCLEKIGIAFHLYISGNVAYVEAGNKLNIFDISNSLQPILLSSIPIDGFIRGFDIIGQYVCISIVWGAGNGSFKIVDVKDPAHPINVASMTKDDFGARSLSLFDVRVSGNYAYLGTMMMIRPPGIDIVDISNPVKPKAIDYFGTVGIPWGVIVSDHYLFTALGELGLRVFDSSNPVKPVSFGYYPYGEDVRRFSVSGQYIYTANGKDGMNILQLKMR